jgi:hypothetical protein
MRLRGSDALRAGHLSACETVWDWHEQERRLRTTLRFTSVVAGVAALVLLAAVILSGNDWLSTSPGVKRHIAVQTSLPAPQASASAPQASAPTPQPGADSGPAAAPPAPAAAPRPAAVVVPATVGQASTGRAAVTMAHVDEEHTHQPAGGRRGDRGDRGHDEGRDRHTGGRDRGDRER